MPLGSLQVDVVHSYAEPRQNFQLGGNLEYLFVPLVHAYDGPVNFRRPDGQLLKGIVGQLMIIENDLVSVGLQKMNGLLAQSLEVGCGD